MTVQEFCTARGIRATAKQVNDNPYMADRTEKRVIDPWYRTASHYRVTLRFGNRSMSTYFSQGCGIKDNPTADTVLECLISDALCASGSFEEFCDDCGYDADSRKAERIYRACANTRARLRRFLGSEYETALSLEY